MLISQPLIMLKRTNALDNIESFCCFLSTLFPKVFCTGILTWSYGVYIIIICYQNMARKSPTIAVLMGTFGTILYVLCIYTYYQIILVGPGSPLDYPELRIHNLSSLDRRHSTNTHDRSESGGNSGSPSGNTSGINSDVNSEINSTTALMADPEESVGSEEPPSQYLILHTVKNAGTSYRYCTKCSVWKPDRTHHCSSSGKCILKMDHYCPWFSICVGYFNQKFFVQFLMYVFMYSALMLGSSTSTLWSFFVEERYDQNEFLPINLVLLFVFGAAFTGAVGFFAAFLYYLTLKNMTTIEFQEELWNYRDSKGRGFKYDFDSNGKRKKLGNIFDLGYKKNFTAVMGDTWLTWLLPISVTTRSIEALHNNGINFEINEELYQKWCQNAELQDQLNNQLAEYTRRVRDGRSQA